MLHSIVEYYAEHESYKCGYCKSPDTNFSHGMWAHTMTASDYQDLIDRGWRRSGKYCYKPTMDVTCCPMYTIRCRVQEFKPSKSQKKVLKRFNKFLTGEQQDNKLGDCNTKMSTSSSVENLQEVLEGGMGEQFVETTKEHQHIDVTNTIECESYDNIDNDIKDGAPNGFADRPTSSTGSASKMEVLSIGSNQQNSAKQKEPRKGAGLDPTKGPCLKAKQLRKERKLEKLKEKGIDTSTVCNTNKNIEKPLEGFINELPINFRQKLQIKLVRTSPASPEWLATAKETHELYVKYQTIIHDDKPEKCSESKFKDFLVSSPLLEEYAENGPRCGYGSFHQQYWLDGKLIAVGVIDVLPKCISSVYFFYDPQYINLSLGTYGALREIAFTREYNTLWPDLKYYYMGFYIHSCRKMRYKGNFYPSDLLCPETYKWFPLKNCISKLESSAYSRLDPDIDSVDTNYPKEGDLNYIPVWVKGVVMPYKTYKRKYANKDSDTVDELNNYMRLVGQKSAKSLVLVM